MDLSRAKENTKKKLRSYHGDESPVERKTFSHVKYGKQILKTIVGRDRVQ